VKECAQLGGDAVDRAGDDAEDGHEEAHGTTSLSAGAESEKFCSRPLQQPTAASPN
jgi:hypothetical protein